MMDDMTTSEIFNDFSGNHWAVQAGTHVAVNLLSFPTDFRVEWTSARPWSYTHRDPLYGTYTHNGRLLGFQYGPNSQILFLENRWWVNTRNQFSISFEQFKWGKEPVEDMNDDYEYGNDANHNYLLANPKYANSTGWLMGDIQTTNSVKFSWEYQLSNIIDIELGFGNNQGMDKSENTVSIQLNVDY